MLEQSRKIALGIVAFSGFMTHHVHAQDVGLRPLVYKGCYSSGKAMTDQGPWTYQSPGYCQKLCVGQNKPVMGTTKGSDCWCGDLLPPTASKVSDSDCNVPCFGYDKNMCGGQDTWSVQLTGIDNSVASVDDNDSNDNPSPVKSSNTASTSPTATPSPSITTKVQPSVVTQAGTVKTVTASAAPVENDRSTSVTSSKQDSGPNKAAIAAGVVVGLVTMGTIIGALVFFLRRRKQRTLKEEYRQDSKNTYIGGAKQTIPTSASSVSDSRLEPSVMMQRRQSDGSIADNQDYSRRILKVTNPDGPT